MAKKSEESKTPAKKSSKKSETVKKIDKKTETVKKTRKKNLVALEEKRLIKCLKNKAIDEDKLNIALDLIKDIAFMTVKTDELKKDIELNGIVEQYQNGANQYGRKKSASFESYIQMTKQKSALIKQLTDLLPVEELSYTPTAPDTKDEFDMFLEVRSNKNR